MYVYAKSCCHLAPRIIEGKQVKETGMQFKDLGRTRNLVMVESEMAPVFCDGSISGNVQHPKLYKSTKFHAFIKRYSSIVFTDQRD